MKTLKEVTEKYGVLPYKVANIYREVAQSYIKNGYSGWPNPPYLTGNLYRRVGSYNTAQKMTQKRGKLFTVTLDFAPPKAEYGYFAETGTGTHSKKGPRPYAQLAANSLQVRNAIVEWERSVVVGINAEVNNKITSVFGKFGKKN
jgi:hypothetical protein